MPQPFNSNDELSLRHLPDVSESSFSFQIPGTVRDNLLIDDDLDLDFFKGTDVSIIAPLASTIEPLFTATPKPVSLPSQAGSKLDSFPTLSYDYSEDHDTNPKHKKANPQQGRSSEVTTTTNINVSAKSKPNPKATATMPTPSAVLLPSSQGSPAVRLDNLRVELNLFNDKLLAAGPPSTITSVINHHQDMPSEIRVRPKGILKKCLEKKQLQRISPRNNQKVIEGGISKTRCATTATKLSSITKTTCATGRAADGSFPNLNRGLSDADGEEVNGDHSFADSSLSSAAAGVAAGRLVMYSQKLINSFGSLDLIELNNACQTFTSQDQQGGANVDDQDALTLSQLSPQKVTPSRNPTPTPRDNDPDSPQLRLPSSSSSNKKKRSHSVVESNGIHQQQQQKRSKKSKTDTISADVSVFPKTTIMPKTRVPVTRKFPKFPNKPISSSSSSNSSSGMRFNRRSIRRKPMSTRVNGPTRMQQQQEQEQQQSSSSSSSSSAPVFKPPPQDPGLLDEEDDNRKDMGIAAASASSCASVATSVSTSSSCSSRLKNSSSSNEKGAEPVNSTIALSHKGKRIASSSSSHGSSRVVAATKPVPFNFQTNKDKSANDDREGSKTEHEKRTNIPNFKAMHAAQEAELALRKENIQPVVPLPIHWETDHRLKERQKFDEKMREKGREQERLMSLRRKEREEQEEREVRELRKKAVPKAHEVPEWYKEAPKKKKDNAIVGAIDG